MSYWRYNARDSQRVTAMIRFVILMLIASVAYAGDTTRIDGTIVTTGMSAAEVLKRAGEPNAREPVQNQFGAILGHRWEYHGGKRMVTLWVQSGKVVRIDEE